MDSDLHFVKKKFNGTTALSFINISLTGPERELHLKI